MNAPAGWTSSAAAWAASWAPAFLGTLACELPVYALALRRAVTLRRALAIALLLNAVTHPLAWSTIMAAAHPFPGVFLLVEGCAVVAEGLMLLALARVPAVPALLASLSANALSAGGGLLL